MKYSVHGTQIRALTFSILVAFINFFIVAICLVNPSAQTGWAYVLEIILVYLFGILYAEFFDYIYIYDTNQLSRYENMPPSI